RALRVHDGGELRERRRRDARARGGDRPPGAREAVRRREHRGRRGARRGAGVVRSRAVPTPYLRRDPGATSSPTLASRSASLGPVARIIPCETSPLPKSRGARFATTTTRTP